MNGLSLTHRKIKRNRSDQKGNKNSFCHLDHPTHEKQMNLTKRIKPALCVEQTNKFTKRIRAYSHAPQIQTPAYKTNRACFLKQIPLSTPFYARIDSIKKRPFYKTNAGDGMSGNDKAETP